MQSIFEGLEDSKGIQDIHDSRPASNDSNITLLTTHINDLNARWVQHHGNLVCF